MNNSTKAVQRHVVNAMFLNNLSIIQNASTRDFRRTMLANIQETFGATVAAAASAYNFSVEFAIAHGAVQKVKRGVLEVLADVSTTQVEHDKWLVVNKETDEVIASAPSKNKAYTLKQEGQVVRPNKEYKAA